MDLLALDISNIVELDAAWRRAPDVVREELTAAMLESELLLLRETQEFTPVGAHGTLRQSEIAQDPVISSDTVIGVVGTSLPYAPAVELGSRPHWAPIEPILEWVRLKLGISEKEAKGVAYRVQRGIAQHGTPAFGMFHRGLAKTQAQILARFALAGSNISLRMGGAA